MPRIPIYTARLPLETARPPVVRTTTTMGNALQRLGRSVSLMRNTAGEEDVSRRARERQQKRRDFDRLRATHDTVAALEAALVERRDKHGDDGSGFYQAFVEEAVTPMVEAAASARPQAERDGFRETVMRQAESLLQAAALIERQQSLRHYMAETERLAEQIIGNLETEPQSHHTVRSDLKALLATAPIPQSARRAMTEELDRRLARKLFGRMLADDPTALTNGALGFTAAGRIRRGGPDPRFQPLAEAERREMFDRVMAASGKPG